MTDAVKAVADQSRAAFGVASRLQWTTGDRLRKIRRTVGLTQPEFAKALSVNLKSLSAWEADINVPRGLVAIAKRIELAFGVPAAWTLGLNDGAIEATKPLAEDEGLEARPEGFEPPTF